MRRSIRVPFLVQLVDKSIFVVRVVPPASATVSVHASIHPTISFPAWEKPSA